MVEVNKFIDTIKNCQTCFQSWIIDNRLAIPDIETIQVGISSDNRRVHFKTVVVRRQHFFNCYANMSLYGENHISTDFFLSRISGGCREWDDDFEQYCQDLKKYIKG